MTITRRLALKGSAFASMSALAWPGWARVPDAASLIIHDSERFAPPAPAGGALRTLDLALDRRAQWRGLRRAKPGGRVIGLTTWSDFLQCRDCLREQGLRLVACTQRSTAAFLWEMTPLQEAP